MFLQPPPVQRQGSCLRVHSGSFCLPAKTLCRVTPPELARAFASACSDSLVRCSLGPRVRSVESVEQQQAVHS